MLREDRQAYIQSEVRQVGRHRERRQADSKHTDVMLSGRPTEEARQAERQTGR
jgi:hypothetical protein